MVRQGVGCVKAGRLQPFCWQCMGFMLGVLIMETNRKENRKLSGNCDSTGYRKVLSPKAGPHNCQMITIKGS